MELIHRFAVVFICFPLLKCVFSATTESSVGGVLNAVLERIETLEAENAAKNEKIAKMELKMGEMELTFHQKEAIMQDQIDELKKTLGRSNGDTEEQSVDGNDDPYRQHFVPSKIKRLEPISRTDQAVSATKVAFYATYGDHDVHHYGLNQVLTFQLATTNIGNAYNNNTGAFVAPVDGTYVFHATLRGVDINNFGHVHASFDVDNVGYSRFWITDNDQSSQMLVIDLKAGQTVKLTNDFAENGFTGQHYSTFSGFLLYQHLPSGAIIG